MPVYEFRVTWDRTTRITITEQADITVEADNEEFAIQAIKDNLYALPDKCNSEEVTRSDGDGGDDELMLLTAEQLGTVELDGEEPTITSEIHDDCDDLEPVLGED